MNDSIDELKKEMDIEKELPYEGIMRHPDKRQRTPSQQIVDDAVDVGAHTFSAIVNPIGYLYGQCRRAILSGGRSIIRHPLLKSVVVPIESVVNYIRGVDTITDVWDKHNKSKKIDNPLSILLGSNKNKDKTQ